MVLTVRLKRCHFENLCNLAAHENSKRTVHKQLLLCSSEEIYFIEKENASSYVSLLFKQVALRTTRKEAIICDVTGKRPSCSVRPRI